MHYGLRSDQHEDIKENVSVGILFNWYVNPIDPQGMHFVLPLGHPLDLQLKDCQRFQRKFLLRKKHGGSRRRIRWFFLSHLAQIRFAFQNIWHRWYVVNTEGCFKIGTTADSTEEAWREVEEGWASVWLKRLSILDESSLVLALLEWKLITAVELASPPDCSPDWRVAPTSSGTEHMLLFIALPSFSLRLLGDLRGTEPPLLSMNSRKCSCIKHSPAVIIKDSNYRSRAFAKIWRAFFIHHCFSRLPSQYIFSFPSLFNLQNIGFF